MNALAIKEQCELTDIENIEGALLELPQVDCPVVHRFADGLYIREATMPKGAFIIGHAHKTKQLNVMLKGKVLLLANGVTQEMTAPCLFVGEAGRKAAYILEDTVWQNIYATDETDIDKLDDMFVDKSDVWKDNEAGEFIQKYINHDNDRADFARVIKGAGFTAKQVREISEVESDQIDFPIGYDLLLTVRSSAIEGNGLFASWPVLEGDMICPARLDGMRTPAGRYTNHSISPNAEFRVLHGDIYLFAKRLIAGCMGGNKGEEITVDYEQALKLSGIEVVK